MQMARRRVLDIWRATVKSTDLLSVSSQRVRADDADAVRAVYWSRIPRSARMVAVLSARLPEGRADSSLTSFDSSERRLVWAALQNLLGELAVIQKCMCGGRPAPTEVVH